jgi:hypothetical protein
MPFKVTCPVEERIVLFREYKTGVFTVSELCRRHGISREMFYGNLEEYVNLRVLGSV